MAQVPLHRRRHRPRARGGAHCRQPLHVLQLAEGHLGRELVPAPLLEGKHHNFDAVSRISMRAADEYNRDYNRDNTIAHYYVGKKGWQTGLICHDSRRLIEGVRNACTCTVLSFRAVAGLLLPDRGPAGAARWGAARGTSPGWAC
eukprot:1194250-Prorocentrum_minimum.AAC.5